MSARFLFSFFLFFFKWLHPWHVEVPRPGIESKPQLQPTPQLRQSWILNPLCWPGDWTCTSAATVATAFGFLAHCATAGALLQGSFYIFYLEIMLDTQKSYKNHTESCILPPFLIFTSYKSVVLLLKWGDFHQFNPVNTEYLIHVLPGILLMSFFWSRTQSGIHFILLSCSLSLLLSFLVFSDFIDLRFYLFPGFFCLFAISWAAPASYGGSQARGPIRAVAAGLRQNHSNTGSKPCLRPTPQLTATPDH